MRSIAAACGPCMQILLLPARDSAAVCKEQLCLTFGALLGAAVGSCAHALWLQTHLNQRGGVLVLQGVSRHVELLGASQPCTTRLVSWAVRRYAGCRSCWGKHVRVREHADRQPAGPHLTCNLPLT